MNIIVEVQWDIHVQAYLFRDMCQLCEIKQSSAPGHIVHFIEFI